MMTKTALMLLIGAVLVTASLALPLASDSGEAADLELESDESTTDGIDLGDQFGGSRRRRWWRRRRSTKAPLMRRAPFQAMSAKTYKTGAGCSCKSGCGATATEGLAACDWCWTTNGCGKSSLRGSWDYCVYPAMKAFDAQSHTDKQKQLWGEISSPSVVGKSQPAKSIASSLSKMLLESMRTTFDSRWEVMPAGREKVIHVQGVHCSFELSVSAESVFTGIFAPGKVAGLIRLGSASNVEGLGGQIFPGLGIKFLRSGVHSANFVALRTAGPGGNTNFFDSEISSHAAPNKNLQRLGKFQQASGCIDMVGLSDVCAHTQDGEKVDKPVFPFKVIFEPAGNLKFANTKKTNSELLRELATIKAGTKLFDVYTVADPAHEKAGKRTFLGSLSTTSQCHQSLFGDQKLFFRHQRMEEDFALRPEWIGQMKALADDACVATAGPASKWQCVPVPGETQADFGPDA